MALPSKGTRQSSRQVPWRGIRTRYRGRSGERSARDVRSYWARSQSRADHVKKSSEGLGLENWEGSTVPLHA